MLKKIFANPFFIFPLVTLIFFWPISLQIVTFKNDALTYYYPVRTLISDALHNYELPLWTPFINMGYPLHADMQSGAWNPVIWFFGFFTNYSLASFHYELMLYLSMGGIGFYFLGREFGWNKFTALLIGFSYQLSGPVIDSIQFTTCISSLCYIPFIFLFFRRLLYQKKPVANSLLTALFLYLLFTGGYPALFIITLYLLLSFLIFAVFSASQKIEFAKKLLLPLGITGGAFILLSLPAILSFVNHLQYIDRGKIQGLAFILENSMPPATMFSLISPFSTTATAGVFNTNILMRNIYMGLVPFVFLIYSIGNCTVRNKKELRFLLITALVLFGIAWGSHFFLRQLAYHTLPLMNTFRHPALFRLFGVIFFLLAAGFGMNEWTKKRGNNDLLKKIILSVGGIVFLISIFIVLFPGTQIIPANITISHVKDLISTLGFQQRFLIQLPFIITTIGIFYFIVSKKIRLFFLLLLSLTDLFFATQLNMPVTVVGARSFSATERLINRNPVKFPFPGNSTIQQNTFHSTDPTNTIGSVLPFEKRIGRNDYFITPGNLSSNDFFYESPIREQVFKNRVLYFADTLIDAVNHINTKNLSSPSFAITSPKINFSNGAASNEDTIAITKLSANKFECNVKTTNPRFLILLQNIYPGWKAMIDGKETPVVTTNISFIGVNVPAGKHDIIFRYRPIGIIYAWYFSLFALAGIGMYLLRTIFIKSFLSNKEN